MKSIFTLLLIALFATPSYAVTLKIATISPDGTRWMKELKSAAKEIKQRTEGRVKFRFYPGGVMGNDQSVMRKMRIGQLHGGAITGGGLQNIYPDSQVYSLPMVFHSQQEVDYVRERMDKTIIDGLYEKGFVSFGLSEGGFAYLMSSQPIDDLKGLRRNKVWSPNGDSISRAAFESIGISPISLPLTDVLTGLQTGLIDTVAASPMGAIALQWHSKVKYLNETPLSYLYGTMIISRKAFRKLSADDQAIVREIMSETFTKLDTINRNDNDKAYAALKQQGLEFVTLNSSSSATWTASIKQSIDTIIANGTISKQISNDLYQYLQAFRSQSVAN